MPCLTTDEFYRYLGGELSAAEEDRVRQHLSTCADCSARLARFEEAQEDVLGHLRGAMDQQETLPSDDAGVTAALERESSSPPQRDDALIPGYSILKELHRGGQGIVYQAVQTSTKRKVAIKLLLDGQFASKAARRRFEREVELVASLKHPHIVVIFDSGQTADGRQYFVMDYVHGTPLTQHVREHELGIKETLTLHAKVCDAIQYAHQRGVIHRDLKPGNILVDESGEPKVLDFGLAKQIGGREDSLLSLAGQIVGTLAYMSPEQARGDADEIDTRTDLYALGVILYEMLTGTTPYPVADAMAQVLRNILEVEPTRPSMHNRSLGDELETIVLKLLSKDRDRRYASAAAVASDVRRYLAGEPIEAKSDSGWYVLKKNLKRYRVAIGTAAAFVVLLGAATIVSATLYLRAEEQKDLAVASARAAEDARDAAQTARAEALDNLNLAEQRAQDLKQVADFQAAMLNDIDIEHMGRTILSEFRDRLRGGLERTWVEDDDGFMRKRTEAEIDQAVATFDRAAAPANPADVARAMLDATVLAPAMDAVTLTLSNQPVVRAQLLSTLGRLYHTIGLDGLATGALRQSLECEREVHGPTHPKVAGRTADLAYQLYHDGDYPTADNLFLEALAIQRDQLGADHIEVARTLTKQANLYREARDPADAERIQREALAIQRKHLGNEHPDIAEGLNNLARLRLKNGDAVDAERTAREALDIRRRLAADDHDAIIQSLLTLAAVVMQRGDLDAAEEMTLEALELARRNLGDEHRAVGLCLSNLAQIEWFRGELDECERLVREAIDIRERTVGTDHLQIAGLLGNLGGVLLRKGDYAAAETLARRALLIERQALGDEHEKIADSLNNLAQIIRKNGDRIEAIKLTERALSIYRKLFGNEHLAVARALSNLGVLHRNERNYVESERYHREALEIHQSLVGDEHPHTAANLYEYGLMLAEKGDLEEADSAFRSSLATRRKLMGNDNPETLHVVVELSKLLRRRGELEEAEMLGAEAVRGRSAALPRTHPLRATAVIRHAETLTAMERFADAETQLLELERALVGPTIPDDTRRETVAAIVRLYEAWHAANPEAGHDRSAVEWRSRTAERDAGDTATQPANPSD